MVQVFCKSKRPTNVDAVAAVILPAVEVRTAQIVMDAAIKGIETLDILERLKRLENEDES